MLTSVGPDCVQCGVRDGNELIMTRGGPDFRTVKIVNFAGAGLACNELVLK